MHPVSLAVLALAMSVATPTVAADTGKPPEGQLSANVLVAPWTHADQVPPFDRITVDQYEPAFDEAIRQSREAIARIAGNNEKPSFENTIEAMEHTSPLLDRVANAFFTVAGADASEQVQAVEERVTPKLTRLESETLLNPRLFARVDRLWKDRASLNLAPEQARLLAVTHLRFTRAGAALPEAQRTRLAAIEEEMSALKVKFSQNLLADQKVADTFLTEAEMAGVPAAMRGAAHARAKVMGHKSGYVITSSRSDVESFLTVATSRDARQKVFTAFNMRGDNGNANDTNGIIAALLRLRLEKAKMLGYETHADYVLANTMAKTPAAATELMMRVYEAARQRAQQEEADLLKVAAADGIDKIEPWDWRFYAEKVRQDRYAFDAGQLKQYLPLDGVVNALFDAMGRLYGISFTPRPDVPPYADGVKVWEVRDADGSQLGLFYGDFFARDTKRPGAWMNELRGQNGLTGEKPIVVNNSNFTPTAPGERATISFDDAETLFHEFGHALHGLFSRTRYPSLAGTRVHRDFVEFPSQINEHWIAQPDLLQKYALDANGQPMPKDLLDAFVRAQTFNQGFETVQQLASALVDMKLHELADYPADFSPRMFEQKILTELKVPAAVGMRHRLAHFSHLFDSGYDAGYYSYTWAEVLEADAFDAFKEAGSAWDRETATRYRTEILERGNSRDPALSYEAFRGRMPQPDALLRNRGLNAIN